MYFGNSRDILSNAVFSTISNFDRKSKMKKLSVILCLTAAALMLAAQSVRVPLNVKWKTMPLTRDAKVTLAKNGLTLTNKNASRPYAGAHIKTAVDLTATPWLAVEVEDTSNTGQVKVLCGGKKVELLSFSKPGTYQADLAKALGMSGRKNIEICVYILGKDDTITYSGIRFNSQKQAVVPTEPEFYVKPTFISAGYYFSTQNTGRVTPFFKKSGTAEWQEAIPAYYDEEKKQYRGSIVRLKENTSYEIKLVSKEGKTLRSGTFKTWADKVKIAKTIVLDPAKIKDTLVIRQRGTADGWIRYTQKKGTVLGFDAVKSIIKLENARYILLDGLNIKGGGMHAIEVNRSKFIRIRNSEITGWGIVGEQRCDYNGRFHVKGKAPSGYGINMNGAINIIKGEGVVVERCYIHDPRNRANSWFYSHPAGPQAVTVGSPESCVIRYNDFVGSDEHRYNDAVESLGNFSKDGGLNRDADIYGNFMIFCSDDNIELDGGQQNVRCFDNRFEGSYCGVSIQGCMTGPSYVFDNTFLNMSDEFGAVGYTLKSCAGPHWGKLSRKNRSYIFNNTFTGPGMGTNIDVFMDYRNNIWGGTRKIDGTGKPHSGCSNVFETRFVPANKSLMNNIFQKAEFAGLSAGDLRLAENSSLKGKGCAIANFTAKENVDPGAFHSAEAQPSRPLGVCVQPQQLNYTCVKGKVSEPLTVKVKGVCPKFSGKFTIRKNFVADWFEVTPAKGVIKNQNELTLTVRIKPGFEAKFRKYRGAFLVRFENGLSRPVSVYLDTDFKAPAYPEKDGVRNIYVDLTKAARGKQYPVISHPDGGKGKVLKFDTKSYPIAAKEFPGTESDIAEYDFEIPKDGIYFLMLRGRAQDNQALMNSCFMALDDAPMFHQNLTLTFSERMSWVWPQLPQANKKIHENKALFLKKGTHKLRMAPRKSIFLDSLCITTDPRIFEDR